MLAGLCRIIEICVFAPAVALPLSAEIGADGDSHSEHTLAETSSTSGAPANAKVAASTAFRHIPPFVR
jgi:hypothetical protein